MYKVIINGKLEYSTDQVYEYVEYCMKSGLIHQLVNDIIPTPFEMNLATKEGSMG